jgi:hypothetical protein
MTKLLGTFTAALACVAATVTANGQVPGPPPAVVLRWNAPSECPNGDQVLADARTLASGRYTTASDHPITVDALVQRLAANRWSLVIAIGSAHQRVEASSCAQLARAGALFVALLMDPSIGAPVVSAPEAGPSAQSPPSPAPIPSPRPAAGHPREVSVLVAAGLMIDSATMPHAALFGVFEGGIGYRQLEVTLGAAAGTTQETTIDGTAGARLRPMSVTLTSCYAALVTRRLRFGPCAEGEVGWIHAEGMGLAQTRATDAAWVSFGGGLAASWVLGTHLEARLDAGAMVPVLSPTFELTGLGRVFEPGFSLRVGTAAVIRF